MEWWILDSLCISLVTVPFFSNLKERYLGNDIDIEGKRSDRIQTARTYQKIPRE